MKRKAAPTTWASARPGKSTSETIRSRITAELLELDGEPTEAAVKATEQHFSVKRSTVLQRAGAGRFWRRRRFQTIRRRVGH